MVIHSLPNGDLVHRFDRNIVIPFSGKRRVLSTSVYQGGIREDVCAVYNHDGRASLGVACKLKGDTIQEHIRNTIEEIGLDPETTTGMETAARMENVAIHEVSYENLSVTAIVTGGIDVNGGRVGDPASWIEKMDDTPPEHRLGTINILLVINADLPPGALTRALVTCTEAKSAALQELQAYSRYSRGLATGSGTDSTVIVATVDSPFYLTSAGKHSKLGELIGRDVMPAVKEALNKQTHLCAATQHNAINRLCRFGVTEGGLFQRYLQRYSEQAAIRPLFSQKLEKIFEKGDCVAHASMLSQLIDQMDWGLLSVDETVSAARQLLEMRALAVQTSWQWEELPETKNADHTVEMLMAQWSNLILSEVQQKIGDAS